MKYSTTMADLLMQVESKKALDKKADKSGMPKGILSKVYDRGMAAWKGGHRPGTTPQQWALARVNSFITKSSGTWGGADSDLAKQVRGRAESVEEARQLKDKDTEMMVVKHSKVIVIDKSDWDEYKLKGYKLAEGEDKDVVSNASGKNNSKSRIDDIEEKTVPKDKDTDQPKKYVSGLSDKDKEAHDKHLEKGSKKSDDDKSAYKQSPADKKAKTKPSVHTKKFKQMYGETKKLLEFTTAQIKTLEKEYAPLKGRTMSGEQLKKMNGILKKYDKSMLQKLANASIPMLTTGAKSELVINRGMKWTDFKEAMKNPFEPKDKGDKEKKPAGEDKDATIAKLEKENQMLKVKAEVDKMVEPNKDTGEVPLKVGLAQKILKDVKDGKRVKVKEKEGAKYKGVGTGQSKIEVDPKVDISPSAGGDK